ncbi:hypothetical protein BDZ91DRAFT_724585 [Kalaharituber pfeilii]|nr:hypothetical protein BDZ91DRAFT_724585 [Kalaharituber pfeilii]
MHHQRDSLPMMPLRAPCSWEFLLVPQQLVPGHRRRPFVNHPMSMCMSTMPVPMPVFAFPLSVYRRTTPAFGLVQQLCPDTLPLIPQKSHHPRRARPAFIYSRELRIPIDLGRPRQLVHRKTFPLSFLWYHNPIKSQICKRNGFGASKKFIQRNVDVKKEWVLVLPVSLHCGLDAFEHVT